MPDNFQLKRAVLQRIPTEVLVGGGKKEPIEIKQIEDKKANERDDKITEQVSEKKD